MSFFRSRAARALGALRGWLVAADQPYAGCCSELLPGCWLPALCLSLSVILPFGPFWMPLNLSQFKCVILLRASEDVSTKCRVAMAQGAATRSRRLLRASCRSMRRRSRNLPAS